MRTTNLNLARFICLFASIYFLLSVSAFSALSAANCSSEPIPTLPHQIKLAVPFLCQAPMGNWAQPWQDACEEAALIMAMHFVTGDPLDHRIGNNEILELVAFQYQKYGGHFDLTAGQAAQLLRDYYHFTNYTLVYQFDIEDIRAILAQENLVIAPMAGRQLNNRYFRRPGPVYHYVVITGYDETKKEFIVNDPGTKRGKSFRYKYANAYNSIHDWNGIKENIASGKKAILIIKPAAKPIKTLNQKT